MLRTLPINRCLNINTNHTKASSIHALLTFISFLSFLLPKQVTIEFWDGEHLSPNQCFKHFLNIIWKLFEPSIHLWNTLISKSPSNLHYITYWASNIQLSIGSCVFLFYHSDIIHISHISYPNTKIRTGVVPLSSPHPKARALHIDLVREIQWVSEQARDWNTLREFQGSFRDHHIATGSAHTSSGNLLQEVSFSNFWYLHISIIGINFVKQNVDIILLKLTGSSILIKIDCVLRLMELLS